MTFQLDDIEDDDIESIIRDLLSEMNEHQLTKAGQIIDDLLEFVTMRHEI